MNLHILEDHEAIKRLKPHIQTISKPYLQEEKNREPWYLNQKLIPSSESRKSTATTQKALGFAWEQSVDEF